ncbi:MAG: C10 family peptidase, partial [Muribaculaceae bacterium]|nr:C10 family peptidase [Muribaculaceae bacterium]
PLTQADIVYVGKRGATDCFYVINTEGGFVIVSADTRLNEVLGYSDEGAFDIERISPDMQWWLDSYCDEIASALPYLTEAPLSGTVTHRASRNPITPMLKTKRNQEAPYNNTCPMDGRYNRRSVTGCVATAMAQIMKFHEWPKQPKGSNGGIVFTGTTYDWGNMLDVYEQGKYNVTEATAVATLMRQCGAAVDMQYSYAGSGAYDNRAQYALFTYFDYSQDIKMVYRDYTMQKEWNNIVYSELAAGRPLYYSGSSVNGGHAFVCDGYSANEYFHFNWGWGGYQDGYFLLSALNPETGGAGSYEGGYNSHQIIFTGIRPADGEAKKQTCILSTGTFY